MRGQTTSGYRHGHQGLPPYTSQAGGLVVSPSYMDYDYMAGYSPKPHLYWAPPPPYSQCATPLHLPGVVPPHQQSQLDVEALPTYEEAMGAQQLIKTELSNSNSSP